MDTQYDIQWIQHATVDIKNVPNLMANDQTSTLNGNYVQEDNADVETTANIDQIAAENLIFLANDETANDGQTVHNEDGEVMSADYVYAPASANEVEEVYDDDETTPQMVTEEVITDDWVQRQGAERVEVSAEQIIGSNSQVVLDIEVPLPTVQDEYTALRPYPCDFCSRRFRKKASLMNHLVAHQNDRPHLCKLCGSRFFRRSALISHLKAHADAPDTERNAQVDLSGFVSDEQKPQATIEDHYYDYDDYMAEMTTTTTASATSQRNFNKIQNGNGNSNSSSTNSGVQRTGRGRVSRLKPKTNHFGMDISDDMKQMSSNDNYAIETNCQQLQASTAAVKFSQDHKPRQTQFFPVIDDSKPFVCQQCGLAFAREKALSAHLKNHRNDSPYECDQCNEMFWDKDALHEHQRTHQFEASNSEYDPDDVEEETQSESEVDKLYGEFYCKECGISFHRLDLLKRHLRSHTNATDTDIIEMLDKSGQHCCNTCGETFEEALDLLAHAEIHARYPPFKCILCGESFFEEATIKRHLLTMHGNAMTINSCILCGKECRDRKALIKHAWDHSREKFHSCSKCGKSFHNQARLKRHMSSHRDKSVACDICFEEFPDGRSLSNHRHSHSTTSAGKLFPCDECGKTFGSRSSQQIHVRIHTGEKPYGCRYCWKAFADGGTLRKHERIHTGEKPYVCSVCSRAFNQRVVLREHIRSHHSGLDSKRGTYFCPLCQESLPSSSDLVQHLIQHSDVNTAKQRKPITGPRKYKRRRKLKPHEIERLKTENSKSNNDLANGSDVDITDIDMENVDDLLAMTEDSNGTHKKQRRKNLNTRSGGNARRRKNTKTTAAPPAVELGGDDDDDDEDDDDDNDNNGHNEVISSASRTRYHATTNNSVTEKLWPSKLSNDDSLLFNVENTLQTIDPLVVGTCSESQAQRTQQFQMRDKFKSNVETNSRTRRKAAAASSAATATTKAPQRARMIHTEKSRTSERQRRSMPATSSSTTTATKIATTSSSPVPIAVASSLNLLPSKILAIVDDYEIISPSTQPPHQISSSPIHIKQEETEFMQQQQQNYRQLQFQQRQQQLLATGNTTNSGGEQPRRRRRYLTSQSSQTSRSSDLYDAQLLLDAVALRKDSYEKFNPSIVQDLEDILRSPLKMDKLGEQRIRNVSECSTTTANFINEQMDEENGLIKIEPNSPDFQTLFNCTSNAGAAAAAGTGTATATNSNVSSNFNKTPERTRSTKQRQKTQNRRYLEFETSPIGASTSKRQSYSPAKKSSNRINAQQSNSDLSVDVKPKITNGGAAAASAATKLNYTTANSSFEQLTSNAATSSSSNTSHNSNHNFDSMSTIDAAAAAVHAAAEAVAAAAAVANSSKQQSRKYYFECEMCSMVFTDRAQLLDHVPIHI